MNLAIILFFSMSFIFGGLFGSKLTEWYYKSKIAKYKAKLDKYEPESKTA